jgi:hypothetical protein
MNPNLRNSLPMAMLLAGFVLWSIAFVVLYGAQATGCRLGWQTIEIVGPVTLQRMVLVALFLGAVALHVLLYLLLRRASAPEGDSTHAFSRDAGGLLAAAALGAALLTVAGGLWRTAW